MGAEEPVVTVHAAETSVAPPIDRHAAIAAHIDSICYMAFVRAAQVASFLSAGLVCGANIWMVVTMAPHIKNVSQSSAVSCWGRYLTHLSG